MLPTSSVTALSPSSRLVKAWAAVARAASASESLPTATSCGFSGLTVRGSTALTASSAGRSWMVVGWPSKPRHAWAAESPMIAERSISVAAFSQVPLAPALSSVASRSAPAACTVMPPVTAS